jgi:superfamily II DNA or RNA helicase
MQSYFLDKQDIIKVTGDRFYRRGLDYANKGRVQGLSFTPSINQWKAVVRGTEIYPVRIFFFEDDDLDGVCSCPAYHTHYTCKHIAAVLIAISKNRFDSNGYTITEDTSAPATARQTDFTDRLVQTFASSDERLPSKQPETLKLEYKVEQRFLQTNGNTVLEVELKAGTSRTYIVRLAEDFLRSVVHHTRYQLTPSFAFDPNVHIVSPEDRAILGRLLEACENSFIHDFAASSLQSEKRAVKLTPSLAKDLLPELAEAGASLHLLHTDAMNAFHVSSQPARLDFYLSTDEQEMLQFGVQDIAAYEYIKNYHYLVKDDVLYPVPPEQRELVKELFSILPYRHDTPQTVSDKNVNQFVSQVVGKLEQIGHVHIAETVRSKVELAPLTAKVYLDETDDVLHASVAFHYGDHVIQPGQKQTNLPVIKRQSAQEDAVLQQLHTSGFRFSKGRFHLLNMEYIYQFLHEHLPALQHLAEVYISDRVQAMKADDQHEVSSSVRLQQEKGMLEISFDINGLSEAHISNVLQAMIEKKKYYRIPDGALLDLEQDSMNNFQDFLEQLQIRKSQLDKQQIFVPVAQSMQVEEALQGAAMEAAFQTLIERLRHPEQIDFDLPAGLNAELRDYQLTGFKWMKTLAYYGLGGILADDMGLGKTLQTIAYLTSEREANPTSRPSLIIVPSSLLYNWQKEFEKFAPNMRTLVISGSVTERQSQLAYLADYDIVITSYPLLRVDHHVYAGQLFDSLVLDEAQAIKNHNTQTAKAVGLIQAGKRFALSGTPIENRLDELWSIFHTISPGLFRSRKTFTEFEPEKIAQITRPFILRRVKTDVLHELPEKIETTTYSDLTQEQKEIYVGYLERIRRKIDQTIAEKGFDRGKLEILAGLTRLRQICCHPSLFIDNYTGQSGKLEQLLEVIRELKQNNKRFLIFSQFASMLQIIRQALDDTDVFYLDGSTPSKERMQMAEAFNEGENDGFLISLKAGGTGLNLTGADTVILFDLWWNPAVEEQAAGRAHRIGQKNVVQVIRLLTRGTIEERIFELQQRKRALVDQIIQPGETMLNTLTEEEIRSLLSMQEI